MLSACIWTYESLGSVTMITNLSNLGFHLGLGGEYALHNSYIEITQKSW